MKSRLAIVFTIFLLFSMDAFGQAEAGSISGTVRDSSGAVLVGATVSARNLATSAVRTAQTGNLGQYTIPGLGNLGYLDPRNPKLDWGSSDFDIRHRVALSMVWETPWPRTGKGWGRQLLGGYTVVPVFTARTGTPFSVFDSTNSLNGGVGFGIPRYVPSGPV